MVLGSIQSLLISKKMTTEAMMTDAQMRAENVELYRRYYDGDHDTKLTPEMMRLLRLSLEKGDNFNFNYCQLVVDTPSDRTIVSDIESDNPAADEWASGVLERNRFDELQMGVHQHAFIDGDSYVMVSPDTEIDPDTDAPTGLAVITHELAYDGISGIVPIYKSADLPELAAVLKFWHVIADNGVITDNVRLNIYYEDKIERYVSNSGAAFGPYTNNETGEGPVEDWTDLDGRPIGIPFVPFRNRKRKNYGISELTNAIGPQDALNREAVNIIMASDLSAFLIRFIIGAKLGNQAIVPGAFLEISPGGVDKNDYMPTVGTLEAGDPEKFIKAANWIIANMSKVTNTPLPDFDGSDTASGEALKARESRFIGKVKRFTTGAGASWEKVLDLCHKIETVFAAGVTPPDYRRFITRWISPEIRSDKDTVANVIAVLGAAILSKKTALSIVGPIFGLDKAMQDRVLAELADEAAQRAAELAATVPGFGNFQGPGNGNADPNADPNAPPGNGSAAQDQVQSQIDSNPTVK